MRLIVLLLCFFAGHAATAAEKQAPVVVRPLHVPQAVQGNDGVSRLYYELEIGNFHSDTGTLQLTAASVYADDGKTPLATFSGAALASLLTPGKQADADGSIAIKGGGNALLLLAAPLPAGALPRVLRNRLTFRTPTGEIQTADEIPVPVNAAPLVKLGAPLRGGRWLIDEGPGNAQSHHWGSVIAQNGRLTIPQRYAIDFFGLDAQGHAVKVAVDRLADSTVTDWLGWNTEVLAVAAGIVRDTQDGIPDHKPLAPQEQPDELTARSLYGNFVVLEVAPGVFVHYAHLRQGSVQVKVGQRIEGGTVVGRLGLTGGAGAPHLHFHVSDKASFADSQGLPFVFDSYTAAGHTTEGEALDNGSNISVSPQGQRLRHRMPLNGDIIGF